MHKIEIAGGKDEKACTALIVLAFSGDPAARFLYPDADMYLACFPRFVRAFGGTAFRTGSAFWIDGASAALWLPPDAAPEEEKLMALFEETAPSGRLEQVLAIIEEMGGYHPKEPHWYLPLIGTDPSKQGQGYGSALLRHVTATCDADGLPAYLEASSPRNVPLYRRHGFEPLGTIQAGESPPITPMLRLPR